MATYTPKDAIKFTLTTSDTTLATVPAAKSWIVKQVVLSNKTGTARTAQITWGPSGGQFSLVTGYTVPANDTVILDTMQILAASEIIKGLASAGSAIDVSIGVVEFA